MQGAAEPFAIDCNDPAAMDAAIAALPNAPAVFALWPRSGEPYLSRTVLLRRRLAPRSVSTWGCGYAAASPRVQYSGSSFGRSINALFAWVLQ